MEQKNNGVKINGQRGIIIPILAFGLVVLIAFLFLVLFRGYMYLIRHGLQGAADTAAVEAAEHLCQDYSCYPEVRISALEMLKQIEVSGGKESNLLKVDLPTPGTISVPDTITVPPALNDTYAPIYRELVFIHKFESEENNLRLQIEIGRWLQHTGFVSLDGDWQLENPGIPRHLIANSVRVTIERPNVIFPKIVGGDGSYSTIAQATAVIAAPFVHQPVAPFAIPACALIDDEAHFQRRLADSTFRNDRTCLGDFIFTKPLDQTNTMQSLPYGTCSQESDIVPPDADSAFFYRNKVSLGQTPCRHRHGAKVVSNLPDSGNVDWDNQRRFYQMSNGYLDNYGVVGLPDPRGASSRPPGDVLVDIRSLIESPLPPAPRFPSAAIGDRFSILPDGLTTTALDDPIWQLISNTDSSGNTRTDTTGFDYISPHILLGVFDTNNFLLQTFNTASLGGKTSSASFLMPPRFGLCNSRRVTLERITTRTCNSDPAQRMDVCPSTPSPPSQSGICAYADPSDFQVAPAADVLTIEVPVIANVEPGLAIEDSCAGINGSIKDPLVNPDDDWEIIGFVKMGLYDSDIGKAFKDPIISCSQAGVPFDPNAPLLYGGKDYDLGYDNPDTPGVREDACNSVRGRAVDCPTQRFIVTQSHEMERAVLVE